MELGQAFARLRSRVTMVEMADRILIKEAPEISEILYRQSIELGIEFHLNSHISHFTDSNTAILENQNKQTEIPFEVVIAGIGREIDHSGLNPESADIQIDEKRRIVVDSYLRTSNRNVFVVGDGAGGPQFSHGAELQATILIKNFLSPFKSKVRYDQFSWVTFTEPEVATFGLSEEQLRQRGKSFEKLVLDFEDDDRAITSNYQYGKLILYTTKGLFQFSDAKLLGGSMIAPNAGEMFQELILARSAGLGIKSLFNKIYPYPTGARVNKTIVLNKYSKSIRPWMTRIMKLIY
jgi:pyruvate/2-oxoglutarate dehydrogenase complex dihydrolipoamide dehydrogenase (E3) component